MLPNTQHSLEKLEALLKQLGFKVRYEKGNFKTGACVLQESRVVVVNRFLSLEARIQALLELLSAMSLDGQLNALDGKQKQLFLAIKQMKLEI